MPIYYPHKPPPQAIDDAGLDYEEVYGRKHVEVDDSDLQRVRKWKEFVQMIKDLQSAIDDLNPDDDD